MPTGASVAVRETYGGEPSFTPSETGCLDRHPKLLRAVREVKDTAKFQRAVEQVPREALECFGPRTVRNMVKSESSVGHCQQGVLLRLLTESIERGETNFFVVLTDTKTSQQAVNECGILPK
jgi:hypothetical protein